MSIVIRKATVEDSCNIADIIRHSMGYENSPALIQENLKRILPLETDLILIAEYNGQPAGFIHAEDYNSLYAPHLKDLMSLAVKEQYQHLKIGTQLMAQVEKWAAETGRKGVRVLSGANREGAHKFYMSLGYSLNKQQMNFTKYF